MHEYSKRELDIGLINGSKDTQCSRLIMLGKHPKQ